MARDLIATKKSFSYKYLVLVIVGLLGFFIYLVLSGRSFLNVSAQDNRINLLQSGWNYLPGVSPQPDGLHVSYLGRAIVQQDGSTGQNNPAVNVYGTHLQTPGSFMLHAALKDIKGSAVIRLYDTPPIVQDEFRVETSSLELKLTNELATVSTWSNYTNQKLSQQAPAKTTSYSIAPLSSATVSIGRYDGSIVIELNGKRLAVLPRDNLLKDQVWFGLSTESSGDSWTLNRLEADATADVVAVNTQDVKLPSKPTDGLQVLATNKRPGFLVGVAVASGPASADEDYRRTVFGGGFGQVTTENVLKWQFVHPQPGVYDFREADGLVGAARSNGLSVHGHALVFGEANPAWVRELPVNTTNDKHRIQQVMTDHIRQTVGHFKGKIASWDVVNEPLADYDTAAGVDGLRKHIWYEALGEEYIANAFRAARQADPQAKLYINDFGLESDDDRWKTFLALMTKLKSQGVPIDGVGFQAHVYAPGDEINSSTLRDHIRELAKLGLTSRISEMDVHDEDGAAAQAEQYAGVFGVCLSEPSCVSWSTWGVTNRYDLWQDENGRLQHGRDFLWDERYRPTTAMSAIQNVLLR